VEFPEETLGTGKYLRLLRRGRYEHVTRVKASGVAVIVPITDDGHLILVEEPRPAINESHVISPPAGLVGDDLGHEDEAMVEAAKRELIEETGWSAARWKLLTETGASPGLTDETMTFFLATSLTKVGPGGGVDDEDITVHEVSLHTVDEWLDAQFERGAVADMKLYAALYFARRYGT